MSSDEKAQDPPATPEDAPSVRQNLLATLQEVTGLEDLSYDEDGDFAIRFGSALIYARVIDEPSLIRFFAPVLKDIASNAELLARLNDINANLNFARFVFGNNTVFALLDVPASPYVAEHVGQGFTQLCAIADGIDDLLQAEFGGDTAFRELVASNRTH